MRKAAIQRYCGCTCLLKCSHSNAKRGGCFVLAIHQVPDCRDWPTLNGDPCRSFSSMDWSTLRLTCASAVNFGCTCLSKCSHGNTKRGGFFLLAILWVLIVEVILVRRMLRAKVSLSFSFSFLLSASMKGGLPDS